VWPTPVNATGLSASVVKIPFDVDLNGSKKFEENTKSG
jgi:hypothetical protein